MSDFGISNSGALSRLTIISIVCMSRCACEEVTPGWRGKKSRMKELLFEKM